MVVKGFIYFIILSDNLKMSFIRLKVLLAEISIARWGGPEQNRPIFPFKPKNIQERSVLHPVIFRERKKRWSIARKSQTGCLLRTSMNKIHV
jgi:hypothetical protein